MSLNLGDRMVHVAYCFDKNYRQHFGASVTSLLLNFDGPGADLCIHVITDEMDQDLDRQLTRLRHVFRASIEIHLPHSRDIDKVSSLQMKSAALNHVTTVSYFRILLANLLSADIDRVLYLDSDTIILSSVRELFNTDMANAAVAGVRDFSSQVMAAKLQVKEYINSGVLLMDLGQWRQKDYATRCLNYAAANQGKLQFADQCTINAVVADDICLLDKKWNHFVVAQATSAEPNEAAVLHFITKDKPWQAWYENSLSKHYWKYLDISPWAGQMPVQPATIEEAQRLARLLFSQGKNLESVKVYENILGSLQRANKS
jgi:UDP-glucose/galactose:(glucosyl)LPS alpha-1,2-glucosyl/galactosyltransferase